MGHAHQTVQMYIQRLIDFGVSPQRARELADEFDYNAHRNTNILDLAKEHADAELTKGRSQ